jgi:hypothetical protein
VDAAAIETTELQATVTAAESSRSTHDSSWTDEEATMDTTFSGIKVATKRRQVVGRLPIKVVDCIVGRHFHYWW